jgi:GMP synthase (glutamine-hydrolysing)
MADTRQIAIIDPAMKTPELDCFNTMSLNSRLPLSYHLPALHGLESLRLQRGTLAGVVILGSRASVHDGYPWQRELEDWLKDIFEKNIPVLGLCYGHQLLAHMHGESTVFVHEDQRKLLGLRTVELQTSPLTPAMKGELVVSHRETVPRLPKGFKLLATSKEVEIDGIQHVSKPIFGLQSHPEATERFLANQNIELQPSDETFSFGHFFVKSFFAFAAQKK